jgi:hypothetical protein
LAIAQAVENHVPRMRIPGEPRCARPREEDPITVPLSLRLCRSE